MAVSLAALPAARRDDPSFFIGNMIPTCISDDEDAAKAVCRKALTHYGFLPNYRNYWREAGYDADMDAVEKAIAEGRDADVPRCFSDKWLADNTLFGSAAKVRDGVAAWRAAGVRAPILVPSSAVGNQMTALEEIFTAFG
jgi:alkanesulfonate monooxygenase SsuD/methylene tetrahydromethanopterin reductase-like flavin-dependent oxidoreductase (luciferase family)